MNFWMVGLNSTQVFCVVCKAPSVEPQVALPYFFTLFQFYSSKGYPVLVVIESSRHDFLWFSCSLCRQGLSDGSVLCPSSQVLPKPVLGIFSTSVPVIHSDLGADDLENAYLRGILQLTHVCFLNLFHLQNVLCFSVNRIKLLCRP